MLRQSEIVRHAHQLREMAGPKAEAIAARRAAEKAADGRPEEERDWTRIRRVLRQRNGPRQT